MPALAGQRGEPLLLVRGPRELPAAVVIGDRIDPVALAVELLEHGRVLVGRLGQRAQPLGGVGALRVKGGASSSRSAG